MTQAAVAADLHQALDVLRRLLAEITFDPDLVLDDLPDATGFVFREVSNQDRWIDLGLLQDPVGNGTANAVNVGQADPDLFSLG